MNTPDCYMMCCMVFFYVLSCRNKVFCYNNFTPSVPSVMLVNHGICLHCLVAIVTNRNYFFVNILIVVQMSPVNYIMK